MKEDVFFKVGYTSYLQKAKSRKKSWTSRVAKIIMGHKVLATVFVIISLCVVMNFWLIFRFVCILEGMHL